MEKNVINWDGGLTVNDLAELRDSLVKPIGRLKCSAGLHDWDRQNTIVDPVKQEAFVPCRRCLKYKIKRLTGKKE